MNLVLFALQFSFSSKKKMSKSKKKKEKESKEEKGFAIPSFPDFVFVVELEDVVLVTSEPITECVFPHYRFETTTPEGCDATFKAADDIAKNKKCLVVDAVNFPLDDPQTYDPFEREKQQTNFMAQINAYRAEVRESWLRLDTEKKKREGLISPEASPIVKDTKGERQ